MIAERCQEITEMSMVYWQRYKKEQDFLTKMNRSLSTYLSSQSVDYIGQASCIQGSKSRKNQVK